MSVKVEEKTEGKEKVYGETSYDTIDINKLQNAACEPESRLNNISAINKLANNISTNGLIYPPAVTEEFIIGDGHRRALACKLLEWKMIPIIIKHGMSAADIFAAANESTKKMSANEQLAAYLNGGVLMDNRTGTSIKRIENISPEFLQKLLANGRSPMIMEITNSFSRYIGEKESTNKRLLQILNWLYDHNIVNDVKILMARKHSSERMKGYMERNERPYL